MWVDLLLIGAIGGLVSLDRTAAFQFLISRPLVTGPIIGLALGDPATGVIVGGLIELIWINSLPLGGHIPPNDCLATVVITAGVILAGPAGGLPDRTLVAFGVLVGLPLARMAAFMESKTRLANDILARRALLAVANDKPESVNRYNMLGLGISFLSSMVFILIASPLLVGVLVYFYPALPSSVLDVLDIMFFCLPLFGIGAVLSNINVKRSTLVYVFSFYILFILLNL